jgi:hypothetical protein
VERRCAHASVSPYLFSEMDILKAGVALATELPAELVLMVVERLGADATIQDWMNFEQECEARKAPFAPLFEAWLRSLSADCTIWRSASSQAEAAFVRRHLDSKLFCC